MNRHVVSPVMIDHDKRGYLFRLIGIDTAIIMLCSFNDGVHVLPSIWARPVIDNIPDHEVCALCRASEMIQRGMCRYDLTDFEWRAIEPILPNKTRGVPRVDDRRVLNGIFWVLRSGAPWREVPERYGPYTTCYNRFRRWMKAAIWDRLMDALASPSDDSVTMIDGTSVRVHHLAATLKTDHPDRCLGRSRGGLTTKIHALTNGEGLPIKVSITPGNAHDLTAANELLNDLAPGGTLLADKAYDADWLRAKLRTGRSWANIPPKANRKRPVVFSPWLYKKRNSIERFFSKLKCYRRVATRYDKLGATFLAMTKLACVRLTLRHYESTA